MTPVLSVIVPTHNPDPVRLRRTLAGLRAQSLPAETWETVLIDNASEPGSTHVTIKQSQPPNLRVALEPQLGLTRARRRGFAEARGDVVVMVDDDNVLEPDYLVLVLKLFEAHPRVGALGGKSLPEFEIPPLEWQREFFALLALRDPGDRPVMSDGLRPQGATRNVYPAAAAPIGAGMALRAAAAQQWMADGDSAVPDRCGNELTSAGDNDIVFSIMKHGWEVAYFPELVLHHLIPASRLERAYLARLNRGIQKSWSQVLLRHDASPWAPIAGWSVFPRQLKAALHAKPWRSDGAYVRWHGLCGHFEGRSASRRKTA